MPNQTNPGSESTDPKKSPRPQRKRASKKRSEKATPELPTSETQVGSPSDSSTTPNQPTGVPTKMQEETTQPKSNRNNKRRRGKKTADQKEQASENSQLPEKPDETKPFKPHQETSPHKQSKSRLDPEKLSKKAWKIFLAEVSEEGVALIGDNDARELSRRCFRLAELFLEEQQRRS